MGKSKKKQKIEKGCPWTAKKPQKIQKGSRTETDDEWMTRKRFEAAERSGSQPWRGRRHNKGDNSADDSAVQMLAVSRASRGFQRQLLAAQCGVSRAEEGRQAAEQAAASAREQAAAERDAAVAAAKAMAAAEQQAAVTKAVAEREAAEVAARNAAAVAEKQLGEIKEDLEDAEADLTNQVLFTDFEQTKRDELTALALEAGADPVQVSEIVERRWKPS